MALKLKEVYNGIECEYWKLLSTTQNALNGTTSAVLGLYVDREQRDNAANGFLKREVFHLRGLDMTRADVYTKIKESSVRWSGAETV